jgi:hypothetical protein
LQLTDNIVNANISRRRRRPKNRVLYRIFEGFFGAEGAEKIPKMLVNLAPKLGLLNNLDPWVGVEGSFPD